MSAETPEPPRQDGRGVPRWAVIGIFVILLIQALAYARAFLMPLVLAVLLALVFSPLRRMLERAGLGSGLAALLIVGGLLATTIAGIATLATPASEWIDNAPQIGRQLQERMREIRGAAEGMREAAEQVDTIAKGGEEPADPEVQKVVVEDSGFFADFALFAPGILAQMAFTLFLLFFLLASGDMFYEKLVYAMPTFADKRRAIRIAHDIERKLSRYLFTITLINVLLGVAIGGAMWALGMPNPLLFAVIGCLLNYIPFLGSMIGVLIAVIVGMISLDSAGEALVAGGAYFALTALEGQLITPWFVGRSLQLNTVVVFVSVTLWAWLWSVTGMLLATPLLVMIRTLCEHIPALERFGNFLSARDVQRPTEVEE
jgi:predicted PurR-regulated permease PerM